MQPNLRSSREIIDNGEEKSESELIENGENDDITSP